MFIPNNVCFIRRSMGVNKYGDPNFSDKATIRYALVRFDTKVQDSTVRADSSATRGNIKEYHATGRVLVKPNVKPKWGDLLIIDGKVFKIKELEPRYNVLGKLDHYEIDLEKAADLFGDEK